MAREDIFKKLRMMRGDEKCPLNNMEIYNFASDPKTKLIVGDYTVHLVHLSKEKEIPEYPYCEMSISIDKAMNGEFIIDAITVEFMKDGNNYRYHYDMDIKRYPLLHIFEFDGSEAWDRGIKDYLEKEHPEYFLDDALKKLVEVLAIDIKDIAFNHCPDCEGSRDRITRYCIQYLKEQVNFSGGE